MAESEFRQVELPGFLRAIGRKLLSQLLARFVTDLAAKNLGVPNQDLPDDEYLDQATVLLNSKESLPDRLNDALSAIQHMAAPEGQARLKEAVVHAGLISVLDPNQAPERLTVQVWLAAPDILFSEHQKQDSTRLLSFQCFGSRVAKADRRPFVAPDQATLHALKRSLVLWFADHHRAVHTTRIEYHATDNGQHWFHVRHGDTCRWTRKIGDQKTEFVRFTEEDEETIVYSPEDNELWINARTVAERELYRAQFGLLLRGDADYFSERKIVNFEPLRTHGEDALDPSGIPEIVKITLCRCRRESDGALHEITTARADDLFKTATVRQGQSCSIPEDGTITRATFLIQFADSQKPRTVKICAPNILKLERASDLIAVARWMTKCGLFLPHSSENAKAA